MYIEKLNSYLNTENNILFNGLTLKFYELSHSEKEVLVKYSSVDELSPDEMNILNGVKKEINHRLKTKSNTAITHDNQNINYIANDCDAISDKGTSSGILDNMENIKLHVSNDCNLRCSYCYADHGKYGEGKFNMNKDQGMKFAKALGDKFPNAKSLLFFGGEPLMAQNAIQAICDYNKENKKDYNYLMQTNGTICDESVKSLIEDNNMKVTVSVDGPSAIHNIHRIFPDGSGSYEMIKNNVAYLNKDRSNVSFIQATYTKQAEDLYSQEEITQIIHKDFDVKRIVVNPVFTEDSNMKLKSRAIDYSKHSKEKLRAHYAKKVKKFFDDVENGKINNDQQLKLILGSIMSGKYKDLFCNAGKSQCSIDHMGNIWPCPLFTNKDRFKLGNVFDEKETLEESLKDAEQILKPLSKSNHEDCNGCSAAFWCRICVASTLNDDTTELEIDKTNCDYFKYITEAALEALTVIVHEGKYNDFIKKFRDTTSMEMI